MELCASYFVQKVSDAVTARVQSDAKIINIVIKISTKLTNKRVSSIRHMLVCAYSDDSNQSAHPHRQIRVLVFSMKKSWILGYP